MYLLFALRTQKINPPINQKNFVLVLRTAALKSHFQQRDRIANSSLVMDASLGLCPGMRRELVD